MNHSPTTEKPKTLPVSPSFIVEREINASPSDRKYFNRLLEDGRIIQNTVLGMAQKRYFRMIQTKPYRELYKELKALNEDIRKKPQNKKLKETRNIIISKMNNLNKEYRLTKAELEKDAKTVRAHYQNRLDSVAVQKAANRAWTSIHKFINKKSKRCHFLKKGENDSFEGKSNDASIVIESGNQDVKVRYRQRYFKLKPIKKNDLYMEETISNILNYYGYPINEYNENLALSYLNGNISKEYYLRNFESTYRVKYNRIVKKEIRGKERFFLQMIVEGRAVPKRKKDGSPRHSLGKGRVGNDFGTQTVGVASDEKVELVNLAEGIEQLDHQLKKIQRKMDRSRRSSNPYNYKEDGTVKKGKKTWAYSNCYKKLKAKRKELYRKTAAKRKLAHQTLINYLVCLGDTFFGEKMNFKSLQKRKKETEKDEKGKYKRKKRFGKTLANKAPGLFVQLLKKRVEELGGTFSFVQTAKFKASQYDHTTRKPIKKQLSERWHVLSNQTKIQRDLYSSFLLKCSNESLDSPDFNLCNKEFNMFKKKHDEFIKHVVYTKIKIKNSGIKLG